MDEGFTPGAESFLQPCRDRLLGPPNSLSNESGVSRQDNGKGKALPITCNGGTEGEMRYSSTVSLTSALDGDE